MDAKTILEAIVKKDAVSIQESFNSFMDSKVKEIEQETISEQLESLRSLNTSIEHISEDE